MKIDIAKIANEYADENGVLTTHPWSQCRNAVLYGYNCAEQEVQRLKEEVRFAGQLKAGEPTFREATSLQTFGEDPEIKQAIDLLFDVCKDRKEQLASAQTRIGELEGELKRVEAVYHAAMLITTEAQIEQREQQIASDAWDACLKWGQTAGNKSQYLASLTGAKKEGGI